MACGELHQYDIGTVFQLTISDCSIALDISNATAKDMIWLKPGGTTVTKTSVPFLTDGTDGILAYTTIANDLDEVGPWSIQAKITLLTGVWYSDIQSFTVYPNLT